jgi:hypothetical protein
VGELSSAGDYNKVIKHYEAELRKEGASDEEIKGIGEGSIILRYIGN